MDATLDTCALMARLSRPALYLCYDNCRDFMDPSGWAVQTCRLRLYDAWLENAALHLARARTHVLVKAAGEHRKLRRACISVAITCQNWNWRRRGSPKQPA
jgi:hypothetical protein